jgi:hypothetical protein
MKPKLKRVQMVLGFFLSNAAFGATTLTGRVYSDRGGPVAGVLASIQRTVASSSYTTYRVITDAHGKFSVSVPDTATYSVCVGSLSNQLLNTCEWALGQSLVPIASGQQTASVTITLQTGVILRIRLDDPQGLLPAASAISNGTVSSSAPSVRFGAVSSDGRYHAAIQVSSDSTGQNHQILVPLNAPLSVSIQATGVQVLNQTGTAIATVGSLIPTFGFQSSAANVGQGLHYQVGKPGN